MWPNIYCDVALCCVLSSCFGLQNETEAETLVTTGRQVRNGKSGVTGELTCKRGDSQLEAEEEGERDRAVACDQTMITKHN